MPDPRFYNTKAPLDPTEALSLCGASATKGARAKIARVAQIDDPDLDGAAVFVDRKDRASALAGKKFALCLATPAIGAGLDNADGRVAICENPRAAFARLAAALHTLRGLDASGAAPRLAGDARIHPTAIIGAGAEIGAGVTVGPYAVIGPGVVIGAGTQIHERVSIWCALVGIECVFAPGAAIGGAGFGFAPGATGLERIPQLGRVNIGDRVEIGAGSCIDRGMIGDTGIGSCAKFDNLVQIAHNVQVGDNSVFAAQVGVAGSARIGARVMIGGQAGIADHLTIGDDARIAAKAGVMRDVPARETWGGYPARPMTAWMRETAALARAARARKKASDT